MPKRPDDWPRNTNKMNRATKRKIVLMIGNDGAPLSREDLPNQLRWEIIRDTPEVVYYTRSKSTKKNNIWMCKVNKSPRQISFGAWDLIALNMLKFKSNLVSVCLNFKFKSNLFRVCLNLIIVCLKLFKFKLVLTSNSSINFTNDQATLPISHVDSWSNHRKYPQEFVVYRKMKSLGVRKIEEKKETHKTNLPLSTTT